MAQFFLATFEDGVLKPHEPLPIPPHTQVRVTVEVLEQSTQKSREAWESIERLCRDFPIDSEGNRMTREQLHERR